MKKIFFLLCIFIVIKSKAQTADEIILKYAKASGGLENFSALKTLKMTGTVTAQGTDLPITVQIINGKAMRSEVEVMGQTVVNVYKEGKGWKINPFQGASTATDVNGTELNDFKTQSYTASQLMDYKMRGYTVESLGQEDVDGVKAYKIKLITDDKREFTYFIDGANWMLIKSINTRNVQGQDIEIETYYTDIKDFNGLKFSTSRTQKTGGQVFQEVHFDKIELNVPVDEKIFDKQ